MDNFTTTQMRNGVRTNIFDLSVLLDTTSNHSPGNVAYLINAYRGRIEYAKHRVYREEDGNILRATGIIR